MQRINKPPSRFIPQLDGTRGIAILLVMGQHSFGFLPVFTFGWAGIDLFFVLSGYLITSRLLAKHREPGYFSSFYRNRALRILPLYYGFLIVFFAGIHFLARKENLPLLSYYTIHWKSFFIFTENWTFIIYGAPLATNLLHFWTLAVEEQFYLVWPVVVYILASHRSRMRVFLAIPPIVMLIRMAIFSTHPHNGNGINVYFNTLCRADSLVIGALLSELHHAKVRIPARLVNFLLLLSIAVIAISLFLFGKFGWTGAFFGTIGNTFTAIVWACTMHKSITSSNSFTARFFSAGILRFFGKISYGLYVLHYPIQLLLHNRLYDWELVHLHWSGMALQALAGTGCLLISVLLSTLSFRYYESFFLRLKKR
jgi:peptidoglycan/LPS O-acetylase OafA/YrhL